MLIRACMFNRLNTACLSERTVAQQMADEGQLA